VKNVENRAGRVLVAGDLKALEGKFKQAREKGLKLMTAKKELSTKQINKIIFKKVAAKFRPAKKGKE
jgi:hypothetical protein